MNLYKCAMSSCVSFLFSIYIFKFIICYLFAIYVKGLIFLWAGLDKLGFECAMHFHTLNTIKPFSWGGRIYLDPRTFNMLRVLLAIVYKLISQFLYVFFQEEFTSTISIFIIKLFAHIYLYVSYSWPNVWAEWAEIL